jgi:DNA processing protein
VSACDACLRRSHLICLLAPRIAGLLDRPGSRRTGLLALTDDELLLAVAGERAGEVRERLSRFDPKTERRRVHGLGVSIVCRHDAGYPRPLSELNDPPAVVFATADDPLPGDEPAVAIVGARSASSYGLEIAYSLGRGLGAAGVTVVSGLALGVDAAAHRGCLDAGGRAVAVLPGGVDVPYPRRNRRLYEQIRERGALISEMPPGQEPFRWSFPARNRIMAGLAQMTVIVEAADPSGSLISAEFARDLGRVVGAVPGRVTSPMAAGCNRLLQDGAAVITGPGDVLDELFGAGVRPVPAPEAKPPDLESGLREVLEAVANGLSANAIADRCGISAGEVRAALARLEGLGLVVRSGLGSYERALGR